MASKAAEELPVTGVLAAELSDPPTTLLAIAVLVERIRGLPREDRNDLFELMEAFVVGQTEEEREAAACGMREILKQENGRVRAVEPTEPSEELRRWMDFVGGRIRHFRERAALTQEQLAERSGLPQSHISRLERGRHSPSSATLEKIAAALGIDLLELDPSA